MGPIQGSGPQPIYHLPSSTPNQESKEGAEQRESAPNPDDSAHTDADTAIVEADRIPYAGDRAQLDQAIRMRDVNAAAARQQSAMTSLGAQESQIVPDIAKQIEDINSVMTHGILTRRRSVIIEITPVQSADRNEAADAVCLNYIHTQEGKGVSLTHPAKGGFPVVLERKDDPLAEKIMRLIQERKSIDQSILGELSERAHHSTLLVIKCDKGDEESGNAALELIQTDGNFFSGSVMLDDHPRVGCQETHVNSSIAPGNITHIILPARMEPYSDALKIAGAKVIFVPSEKTRVPYNVWNRTIVVTIQAPDYLSVLKAFPANQRLFTHMMRSSTSQELGKKSS